MLSDLNAPRMRLRGLLIAIPVSLALWTGIGLAAHAAAATPPSLDVVTARVQAELTSIVGPLPERPVVVGDAQELLTCGYQPEVLVLAGGQGCAGLAYEDHILIDQDTAYDLALGQAWGVHAGLHEMLHSERDESDPSLSEGIVDAVALDLCPSVRARIWHARGSCGDSSYESQVAGVRFASARATGTRWHSRAARSWRKALWAMDSEGRAATYQAAWS